MLFRMIKNSFQKCFHVFTEPPYLSEFLQMHTPLRDLRSSTDTRIFKIPRSSSKTLGQKAVSHAGPSARNDLPDYSLRHSEPQTSDRP